jgi:hypothetical protein
VTPGVRYFDDLDGTRPPSAASYWIATTQAGPAGTINLVTSCRYQSATSSYRFGAASTACAGNYPNSVQSTLSLGGNGTTAGINGFAIPASTLGPQMSFNIWYNFETRYDGAWLVYSTTGAAGPWTHVGDAVSATAPYISTGGYDNTLQSNPATRIWTSTNTGANGALKAVTVNINSLAGQTVWFGFRFHTDGSVESEGFYVDEVRINADGYGSCTTNVPPPGPAVAYQVTGLPASVGAGTPATFTLTAMDNLGQTATSYNGTASFTSTDPQAVLPATATFTAGVASASADFRTLGAQSITASDTVTPSITGSGNTTITAGAAAGLAFTMQPSDSTAGASIFPSVTVGLVDQFGNTVTTGTNSITLALAANPAGGTLSGTTTVAAVNGVATFGDLSLDKAGAGYTLAASSTGLTGATSDAFAITAGAPASLAYLTQPSNTGAGVSIAPAVQVALLDAFGNATDATDDVTVSLGNNPGGGPLGGSTTVAAVNGVATFSNLSLTRIGSGYTLEANSGALPRITSSGFDITSGPPYRVTITQQPSDVIAGAVIAPSVQATLYDRYGNPATLATTPVSVSLGNNPVGGTLGGTTTIAAAGGVATFGNLSVDRAGLNYTLVAGASGIYSDTSVGFDVGVGAPAALAFTASPSGNVTSGAAFTARVAVRDAGGNLVTGTPTQVTLSLTNAAGATLSGTPVATTINGVATFTGLSVDRAGSGYALQANATGLVPATSPAFGVNPGAASELAFTTQPGNSTAGAAIAPAISLVLRDAQGNTVTTSSANITLALGANPAGGTLSGSRTVAASNGVATFNDLSLDKAGTGYTLQATSGALNATSNSFDVAAGAAARLSFRTAPANSTAGTMLGSVQLEIRDALGNLTSSAAQVTVSLGGPAGGMLGGTTTVAASGGVATFNTLVINQAANGYTLTASTAGLQNITSGAFDIAPAAAAQLAFSTQPGNTVAGAPITPAVRVSIRDSFGNLLSSSTQNVTLALAANPAGGTLSGTTTVAAVNGVATFGDLSIARAGTGYTLTASGGSLTSATSAAFDVAAGNSTRLVFRMVPTSTTAGSTLATTTVELQDANGNRVSSSLSITLSLQGGQGGSLGGTTTVSASSGLATFSDLSIARAGMGYGLVARAAGVADATSTAFDISHGAVAELHFTVQPGNTRAGSVISPAVRVTLQDAFGNVATSATDSVTVALGNNPRNGTLSGTKTVNAINGVATFGNLSIDKKAQGYTLRASSGALTQATSAAFDITNGGGPRLVLGAVPAQVTAGEALPSIEVQLQDELGNAFDDTSFNVSLGLGENTVAGQLYGRATVASTNGVAKFDGLTLRKAGSGYTLVATAQGFEGATSTALTVVPAAAASYALTFPASVTAGQEATLSASAYDAYGNQASSYGGTAKVTSSDSSAAYSANATFVEGVLQSLKVTFKTSGLRTLTVTDTEKDTLAATAQLNVTPFAQPSVAVTDPVGGTSVTGSVSINATAVVAPGTTVAKLQLLVDGKEIASGSEATLAGSWNSDEAEGGSHVITAIVTDGAGNMVNSAPVIVFTELDMGCGCGATSGTDAGIYLLLLVLARFVLGRSRRQNVA